MSSDVEPDEFEELATRAALIEAMMESPGWAFYVDYCKHLSLGDQQKVLRGDCETLEKYYELTGKLKGIQLALDAPARLRARLETERARIVASDDK